MEDPLDIEKTAAGHRFPNRGFGDSEDAGSKCALEGRWIEEIEKKIIEDWAAGFLCLDLEVQTWYILSCGWSLQIHLGKLCVQLYFLQLLGITDFQGRKDWRVQLGSSPASSLIRRKSENFRTIAKRSKTKQIFHRRQLVFFVAEYFFTL